MNLQIGTSLTLPGRAAPVAPRFGGGTLVALTPHSTRPYPPPLRARLEAPRFGGGAPVASSVGHATQFAPGSSYLFPPDSHPMDHTTSYPVAYDTPRDTPDPPHTLPTPAAWPVHPRGTRFGGGALPLYLLKRVLSPIPSHPPSPPPPPPPPSPKNSTRQQLYKSLQAAQRFSDANLPTSKFQPFGHLRWPHPSTHPWLSIRSSARPANRADWLGPDTTYCLQPSRACRPGDPASARANLGPAPDSPGMEMLST